MRYVVILLCLTSGLWAGTADRVAVVVGTAVLTETEVLLEVRVTQFLNGEPLDLSSAAKRAAAERLVDQQLIRAEMYGSRAAEPESREAAGMLQQLQQARFTSEKEFATALQQYGVAQKQVQEHLLWQLSVLRFTDARFRGGDAALGVDQQMNAWLQEARGRTRIQFKPEAFE